MSWGEPPSNAGQGDESGWGQDPSGGARDPSGWGQDPPAWGQDPPANRLRPLNLSDVLDGMFRLVRDHWRAFTIGLGIVVVPLTLLSGLVTALTVGMPPSFVEMMQDPEALQSFALEGPPTDLGTALGVSALSALAGIFLTPLIYGIAIYVAAVGYRSSGDVDAMTGARTAGRRYWGLLGTTILQWLVPFVFFLLPLVLLFAGAVSGADGLAVIGGIGMLVSAVFAIIAVIRLVLAIPVLVIERVGPVASVQRSNALVKGKTGMMFLSLLVIYIITVIIGLVLTFPFNAAGGALGDVAGAVITTLGQMLSSLVTYALLGAAIVLLYFDRRVRTEGYDLTELANELGEPQDPPW